VTRAGRREAAVFTPTLSAPGPEEAAGIGHAGDAAAHGEGDAQFVGHLPHPGFPGAAVLQRGGDVEEDELVRALGVVAAGQLRRVPEVTELLELDALHDAALFHVQAGDDAFGGHQSPPASAARVRGLSSRMKPSRRALPLMAPTMPGTFDSGSRSASSLMPPEACTWKPWLGHPGGGLDARSRQGSVPAHVGHEGPVEAEVFQGLEDLRGGMTAGGLPAMGDDAVPLEVEGGDDVVAGQALEGGGLLHGEGAHHRVEAQVQDLLDGGAVAQPSPHLEADLRELRREGP
jgi:hypothetical protein